MDESDASAEGEQIARWRFDILPAVGLHGRKDPWDEVIAIVDLEGADGAYWSLRAFALTSRFELALRAPGHLVWVGPLFDLACAMHDWSTRSESELAFMPVEQAPAVSFRSRGAMFDVYVDGGLAGTIGAFQGRESIRAFLLAFAEQVRLRAPRVAEVPGLEWLHG